MEAPDRDERYQVVFSGTAEEGSTRRQIMLDVQRVLKLDDSKLAKLFGSDGEKVIFRSNDIERAKLLAMRLRQAGAQAFLINASESNKSWRSWELASRDDRKFHAFMCPACKYAFRLPLDETIPEKCPQCGVNVAKYEADLEKKRRAEDLRRNAEEEEAQQPKQALETKSVNQDALRKQIEKELRQQLRSQYRVRFNANTWVIATATFCLGVALTVLLDPTGMQKVEFKSTTPVVADKPSAAQENTLSMADELLKQVGVEEDSPQETFALNGSTLLDARQTAALDSWVSQTEKQSDKLNPANPPLTDQDPIIDLNDLPATAAGAINIFDEETTIPPEPDQSPEWGDQTSQLFDYWHTQKSTQPLQTLRLTGLIKTRIHEGKLIEAARAALIGPEGFNRASLILPVIAAADASPADQRIAQLDNLRALLARQNGNDLAIASWLTARLAFGETVALTPLDLDDVTLTRLQTLDATTRTAMYAQVGALFAHLEQSELAQSWFDRANGQLNRLDTPLEQFAGLLHITRAYLAAGDRPMTARLLWRLRSLIIALPEQPRGENLNLAISTLAEMGSIDDAVALSRTGADSALEANLVRSELALRLAASGQDVAAQAMAAGIRNVEVQTRTYGWLSQVAADLGRTSSSQRLADRAAQKLDQIPSRLADLIRIEIGADSKVELAAEPIDNSDGSADAYLAEVTHALGWRGDFVAAREHAEMVRDVVERARLNRALDSMQSVFDEKFAAKANDQLISSIAPLE